MTETKTTENDAPAIEDKTKSKKAELIFKLKLMAVLTVVAALGYSALALLAPERLASTNIPNMLQNDALPSATSNNIESNSAVINTTIAADSNAVEPEAANPLLDVVVDALNTPDGADALEADTAVNVVEEAKAEVAPPVAPTSAAVSADELLRTQNQLIGVLRCQVNLNNNRTITADLHRALKQCYAVVTHAGVPAADYKILLDITGDNGVPSKEQMVELFKTAAVQSLRMTHKESGFEKNWLDDSLEYVTSLFTIRRKGWQEGGEIEAIIGRAEHYLQKERYEKSRIELESLPASAKEVFKPFTEALVQYSAFENVLIKLHVAAEKMEGSNAL